MLEPEPNKHGGLSLDQIDHLIDDACVHASGKWGLNEELSKWKLEGRQQVGVEVPTPNELRQAIRRAQILECNQTEVERIGLQLLPCCMYP